MASYEAMLAILHLLGTFVVNLFKSRRHLKSRTSFYGISPILP